MNFSFRQLNTTQNHKSLAYDALFAGFPLFRWFPDVDNGNTSANFAPLRHDSPYV